MTQQLWNSVIAKYRDLSVSRTSIICRSRLLATDKSGYFAQPRPVIVNYFNRFYYVLILPGEILCWPTLLLELRGLIRTPSGHAIGLKATEGCFKSNSTIILSLALKKPSLQRVVTRFVLIPLSPGAKYEF